MAILLKKKKNHPLNDNPSPPCCCYSTCCPLTEVGLTGCRCNQLTTNSSPPSGERRGDSASPKLENSVLERIVFTVKFRYRRLLVKY